MSIQEATTPSSTTGSTGDSPVALQPGTPVTPNSVSNYMQLPGQPENDNMNKLPVSGTTPAPIAPPATIAAPAQAKRKPSRRANTAERRATHNAVERQRRETLNGRFLDLAALLPNLATVRRPSKSAIVNSSIALLHSNRRQRLIAARELRLLKMEADALRRELNEWRDRSALPRVEEAVRSTEFIALLGLEGEAGPEGEQWWDTDGSNLAEMGEEERRAYELVMRGQQEGDDEDGILEDGDDDFSRGGINPGFKMSGAPSVNSAGVPLQLMSRGIPAQQMSFTRAAVGAGMPPTIGFDGMPSHPALNAGVNTMYEPNGHPHGHSHSLPVHPSFSLEQHAAAEKLASAWGGPVPSGNAIYNSAAVPGLQNTGIAPPQWAHQLSPAVQQGPQALFTPPGTAGSASGQSSPLPIAGNPFSNAQSQIPVFGGIAQAQQQQQGMSVASLGHGHVYASPELDDTSSVGSARSVGGSPGPRSNSGSFDMGVNIGMDVGGNAYVRRPSLSLNVSSMNGQWAAGSNPQAITTGGGGRHINAMMNMMM